jgi:glycosyltransferase involved in cell wall biosynthesis
MKTLFILGGLSVGGAEKTVHALAHHRLDQGDEVVVAALSGTEVSSYLPYHKGITIRSIEDGKSIESGGLVRLWKRIQFIRRLVREVNPDIIVSFLTKVNIAAILSTIGSKVPLVISERNNPVQQKNSAWTPIFVRILYPLASCIVMQTANASQILSKKARSRSVIIPNAASGIAVAEKLDRPKARIVAAGRLVEQKGFDLLIEAFSLIASRVPDASLVIYGEGRDANSLQQLIENHKMTKRIKLAGLSAKPHSWVEDGEIFVLSSRFEGFPNVLLEALSAGLAVVSFDCDWGPADILENGQDGLLIGPGDVEGLASAMERLLVDKELRHKLSNNGRLKSKKFSTEQVFSLWDDTLKNAALTR